ncbi:MAG: hypothetical protein ABEJ31_11575 [Haloarculaceae archaeon]
MTEHDVEDLEDFRAALSALLADAEAAGVSRDARIGLLSAHLAALRGTVRLPLSMPPARARTFTDRAAERVGQSMEVELLLTDEVIDELELQLQVFEGAGGADAAADDIDGESLE